MASDLAGVPQSWREYRSFGRVTQLGKSSGKNIAIGETISILCEYYNSAKLSQLGCGAMGWVGVAAWSGEIIYPPRGRITNPPRVYWALTRI
jgi:hypothetical protein